MKDQTMGTPYYKTMGHAAHTAKIEWVISHFDGAMAQGAVLTETLAYRVDRVKMLYIHLSSRFEDFVTVSLVFSRCG